MLALFDLTPYTIPRPPTVLERLIQERGPLRRKERLSAREVFRHVGFNRSGWRRGADDLARQEKESPEGGVLQDPGREVLKQALEADADWINEGRRKRLVPPLLPDPVLRSPNGFMEDSGNRTSRSTGFHAGDTSFVAAAWVTVGGVKFVRSWATRGPYSGYAHSFLFLPKASDRDGLYHCWTLTFPARFHWKWTLETDRLLRILEQLGPPGEDDRVNLAPRRSRVRAHVPGLGVIVSDRRPRPQLVQVVVRDPSTGFRHHLSVPPRFGNPRSKIYQKLGTSEARIRAALAWTFGMKPEEYEPALEA